MHTHTLHPKFCLGGEIGPLVDFTCLFQHKRTAVMPTLESSGLPCPQGPPEPFSVGCSRGGKLARANNLAVARGSGTRIFAARRMPLLEDLGVVRGAFGPLPRAVDIIVLTYRRPGMCSDKAG
jgi:hypothetical protein